MKRNEWKEIEKYLPEGWEKAAKETKALCRGKEIKTASDLLALNLMYLTVGGSYQGTSIMMKMTQEVQMNKNAVYYRIKHSGGWLRWLAERICHDERIMEKEPEWLEGRPVIAIDASDLSIKGSEGSDYRVHYAFDLFGFQKRELHLTKANEGEKLTRYAIQPGDIVIADRIYCTQKGIAYAVECNADYVLRFRANSFLLYDETGKKLDLLEALREQKMSSFESMEQNCFFKNEKHELKPIRIIAMKKDGKAIEASRRKIARKASRKQQSMASPTTIELNDYVILATSLSVSKERILELYRARWQIEMVFFRLKSLFGMGQMPCRSADSIDSWFYGKLFLAFLCEAIDRDSHFSPCE